MSKMEFFFTTRSFLILLFLCIFMCNLSVNAEVQLVAEFSQSGLQGNITFTKLDINKIIIKTNLIWTEDVEYSDFSWSISEFPVDYTYLENRCDVRKLGQVIFDLNKLLGPFLFNETYEINSTVDVFTVMKKAGVWGRSILLTASNDVTACATLMNYGKSDLKIAQSRFNGVISGSVYFQWLGTSGDTDTVIYINLYHTKNHTYKSQHKWKIFTTDVLESESDKSIRDCNSLQVLYDPHGYNSGDLYSILGSVTVGTKEMFRDVQLAPLDLHNKRHLYLVVFDNHHLDSYLGCARIVPLLPVTLKSLIQVQGVRASVIIHQYSPFTPTLVTLNWILGNNLSIGGVRVHNFPPLPAVAHSSSSGSCEGIGDVYNPSNKPIAGDALPPGEATQDKYAVGDISGKLGYTWKKHVWDLFLPLSGRYSIRHRSLVIYRNTERGIEEPWICLMLVPFTGVASNAKVPMVTVEALFRYPIAGRIILQQPQDDFTKDTTVIIEMLVHADGTSLNNTHDHRWGISVNPPGKDFYNWTGRCLSAGSSFDPYKVLPSSKDNSCDKNMFDGSCTVGSLSERLGMLSIAGSKAYSVKTSRKLFTDQMTPLSGINSVVGRSLVVYADNGPKARGDRLACSKITSVFRRKGVVREWFGNGIDTSVTGKLEFLQQTEYDTTDMEFTINGIKNAGVYHIHEMPVKEQLEFPCEESVLYETYDPYKIAMANILPAIGTPDQYPVGDLSGKFGRLENVTHLDFSQNDSTIMLFGQQSVLSRSVVIFKQDNSRWTCGTIERGYSPMEARELRAIASFHHPNGFAYGYMRMTQLIHNDGSVSDTIIEVNVRHPGVMDRNITRNHNWAIYVNPVGVDASVKVLDTRCTAGGYIWNPYYTQLADPLNSKLYKQECGPDHPLRCYVGDLSGRLGTIDVGDKKKIFSDSNFPLEGPVSALGRSIVILDKNFGHLRFACANIEPDKDTIKYVNIRRPPKFTVSKFMEEIHAVLGIPEWFLTIDTRHTKILHNGACIQLLLHFKGPEANKLELDFSVLISTGKLESPSLYIPGYIHSNKRKSKISYKLCGSGRQSGQNGALSNKKNTPAFVFICLIVLIEHYLYL